jgi:hypothetical protein
MKAKGNKNPEKLMQDDSSNKDDISKSGPAVTPNTQSPKPW